jgi:hypothetical protein
MARKLKAAGMDLTVFDFGKGHVRHRSKAVADEAMDACADFLIHASQQPAHGDKAVLLDSTGSTVHVAKMFRVEPIAALETKFNAQRKAEGKPGLSHEDFYEMAATICPSIIHSMAALDPVREKYGRENFIGIRGTLKEILALVSDGVDLPTGLLALLESLMKEVDEVDAFMKDKHNGFQTHFGSDSKCSSHSAGHAFGTTVLGDEDEVDDSIQCDKCSSICHLHIGMRVVMEQMTAWARDNCPDRLALAQDLEIVLDKQLVRMWQYVDHMARIAWESHIQVSYL